MEEMCNETVRERNIEIAKTMLASKKLSYEDIALFSGLTVDELNLWTIRDLPAAANRKIQAEDALPGWEGRLLLIQSFFTAMSTRILPPAAQPRLSYQPIRW